MTNSIRPSLEKLLKPKSIAIAGASERPDAAGTRVIDNLRKLGYPGSIYPVNPRYSELSGTTCYPSLSSLPEKVDAVFIAVPSAGGPELLKEAGECGISAAFINASGYADGDHEGHLRQEQLKEIAARYNIAVCGPNNIGLMNVHDRTAIWTPKHMKVLKEGTLGVISQSGSIALILSEDERDMGFAYLITTGNEAVVDVADYLSFMAQDDRVKVILLFLETVRNPTLFAEAAREAGKRGKPVIVLKLGTSSTGQALVQAHTGSLAGEDRIYDAFFKDLGIVRVRDLDEMLETAMILSLYPHAAPAAGTVVLTLSGGEAALIADLGEQIGLTFPKLSQETLASMRPAFPPYSKIGNPVDAWGLGFNAERFEGLVGALLQDPAIGTIAFSVDAPGRGGGDVPFACAMAKACVAAKTDKQLVFFNNTSGSGVNADVRAILDTAGIPYLSGMRPALMAIRNKVCIPQRVSGSIRILTAEPELPVSEVERFALLSRWDVPMIASRAIVDREDAVSAADLLGYPVVLKGVASHLPHKSDLGLVRLALQNQNQVRVAFDEVAQILEQHNRAGETVEIVVQSMAAEGIELILGVRNLPGFGSYIVVGPGGILVELTDKVSIRRSPVNEVQAMEMLHETVAGKLLSGIRGKGPWDIRSAARAIAAFSRFGAAHAATLAALEINPIVVTQQGVVGVDVLFESRTL